MDLDHPFGFVAGRWAFATADTAGDPDRGPDYVPASGATITFTPETPRQVVPDTPGWTGVINKRVVGKLNEEGRLVDAEGHNHLALGVGTYAVHYFFGNDIKWPSHRIQVTEAHTASNPLWLPPMPAPPDVPGAVNRTIQVPADGADGQVLVWDGAGFSWADVPEGPEGPAGDVDAEQLAGAPRLTNEVHDKTWVTWSNSTINSQSDRLVKFTVTARNGYIRISHSLASGASYYFTAEVKTTSDRVYIGTSPVPVYHSGSGNWERLTGRATQSVDDYLMARDGRSSGWDQIEVRDPVLINLTEVFGAGREPTKEYMDALLAKHGNYVGGVDQFAFGDALQALTVAGPGLTLRHDNSVGERVFLDHPGGSAMLHGDTGWRDVTSLIATPSLTLSIPSIPLRMRRVGVQVFLAGMLKNDSSTAVVNLLNFPAGALPAIPYITHGVGRCGTSPIFFNTAASAGTLRMSGTIAAEAAIEFEISWNTTQPWPSTLWGTSLD